MDEMSHIDERGRARMVDVSAKEATPRRAVAEAVVRLSPAVAEAVIDGGLPKGDAVAVVRVAAILGAKRTPDLIPLCHPITLDAISVDIEVAEGGVRIVVEVVTTGPTGVEMEAMTGAAIGAVTLYDMVKGLDRGTELGPVRLLAKSGGKSGSWQR